MTETTARLVIVTVILQKQQTSACAGCDLQVQRRCVVVQGGPCGDDPVSVDTMCEHQAGVLGVMLDCPPENPSQEIPLRGHLFWCVCACVCMCACPYTEKCVCAQVCDIYWCG